MIRIMLLNILITTIATGVFAKSFINVMFGAPLLVANSLIFAESNAAYSKRVICITRDGRKRWDIERTEGDVRVWFSVSNSILATTATDILLVNIDNGAITKSHKGFFQNCSVHKFTGTSVLICHDKGGVDMLTCLDLNTGKIEWQITNVTRVLDDGPDIVMCKFAERVVVDEKGFSYANPKLCAIRGSDGCKLWDYKLVENSSGGVDLDGGRVENYFIVANAGSILCFESSTGKIVSHHQIEPSLVSRMSLSIKNEVALLWFPQAARISTTNYPTLSRITIPDLCINGVFSVDDSSFMKVVFFSDAAVICRSIGWTKAYDCQTGKPLWDGGQWNYGDVSDGWLYFSETEYFGKRSSIKRIKILTGVIEKIYEEEKRDIFSGTDMSTNEVEILNLSL